MSATVEIQTKKVTNALSLPIMAVTTRIDSALLKKNATEVGNSDLEISNDLEEKQKSKEMPKPEEVIFIYKDGKVKQVKVQTGIQDNDFIYIISGVTEKDQVVTAPYGAISKKLKDGMEVNLKDKELLFEEPK
jgi:HlyD family secretion protein